MQQIERLLRSLNDGNVRYLIIGATAFAAHGWVRATLDIDLYISSDMENVTRLRNVLQSFGYDMTDVSAEDFRNFKILLRQYDLPLDLHPFVKGADSFEDVWNRRVVANIGDIEAPFASLDDLIRMKRAAGRPKDLDDLKELEKLEHPEE